jgi:hypothetical protein
MNKKVCSILQSSDVTYSEHDLHKFTYSKDKVGHGSYHESGVTSLFPQPGRFHNSQNSDR